MRSSSRSVLARGVDAMWPGRGGADPATWNRWSLALVVGQAQGASQRRQYLLGRRRPASLLEPHEVVDRDPRLLGHLLAPQAGDAAPGPRRQAEVGGRQPGPVGLQGGSEGGAIHAVQDAGTSPP
jgi:hypothetical protein